MCWYRLAIEMHSSWALSFACSVALRAAFADHAGKRANTKVCSLGVRAVLSCLYPIPVEVNGALSATRSVGPLVSIRGVGPHSWKGSRIDIEKAAVWQ